MDGQLSTESGNSEVPSDTKLKLQILAYDSYQTSPSPLDKSYSTIVGSQNETIVPSNRPFAQVPVIRVFGKLSTGHTVLVHVHNCFPYIFVQYDELGLSRDAIKTNLKKFKLDLEKQLFLSFKKTKLRKPNHDDSDHDEDIFNDYSNDSADAANYENKYIASLQLVKSIPFYGYHVGYTPFIKISLLNPRYLSRLSSILLLGKVGGKVYQPYEAHIPYLLQFLADFNMYGCDWMYLQNCLFRSPVISTKLLSDSEETEFSYHDDEINLFNEMKLNQSLKELLSQKITPFSDDTMIGNATNCINVTTELQFPRISSTFLEIDCIPQWILNRKSLLTRDLHHDFIEIASSTNSLFSGKYLSSTLGILKDVEYQRQVRDLDRESFFSKLSLMYEGDVRDFNGVDWIEQQELDDLLKHCIDLEKDRYKNPQSTTFETFVKNNPLFEHIQTCKESIDSTMFTNIQWQKIVLLENTNTDFSHSSSSSSVSLTPVDYRVLPSSMFENENLTLSDDEMDAKQEEPDWMGTIPPHKSQPLDSEDNDPDLDISVEHSTLDRLENELFARPTTVKVRANSFSAKSVSFSVDELVSSDISNDKIMFSQLPKRKTVVSPILTQSRRNSTFRQSQGSFYEFVGSQGLPPNDERFLESFEDLNMMKVDYPDPFYSNIDDVALQPFIFAGKKFELTSNYYSALPEVLIDGESPSSKFYSKMKRLDTKTRLVQFVFPKPSYSEVDQWTKSVSQPISKSQLLRSQIIQNTPMSKYNFKFPSVNKEFRPKKTTFNKLITLAIEIHVNTRGNLKADPKVDEVNAIFWSFDKGDYPYDLNIAESGILIMDQRCSEPEFEQKYTNLTNIPTAVFDNEISMVRELVSIVKLIDPDLLAGFELHNTSWGYIIERFREFYSIDLCSKLSRVIFKGNNKFGDNWGYTHASSIRITGRHMMNLWRILRGDMNLLRYTLENITYHLLHRRVPHYTESQLTEWFKAGDPNSLATVLNYYTNRVKIDLEILDKQEIISKTTEQARLIGVDFYSVFYRGSQFKVESFLIRLTKSENFMLISPSKQQVFQADALQCIPLIMEPTSAFYKSPLVVLDFQSLYPSLIIAYNYCYSTMLGRMRGYNPKYAQSIGITKNKLKPGLLDLLKDHINIAPNGIMFVKPEVRKSSLAKMLTEIIETRLLVKKTMVDFKDDYDLNKLYNSRQLALKLLANVTYGYTSASFSGRMPCADIADSIVSSGRETLNKSIKIIEDNPEWGAKVVYGDTDSLFVYFPGKTKADGFRLGREIALYITSINPKPVTLKFEKVYHPCVLLSKKRYVGYSYTYEAQESPVFDAKGIETVRRDGIPAQQKIVEKCLRVLFETNDLSQVKEYVQDQFQRIMTNRVSVQDFCFAKEVRMGKYKDDRYAPPGAHISKKAIQEDKRAEPQYKERVPYVVIQSYKGDRLKDRCVSPQFFLDNEVEQGLRLDAEYYITKVIIPPLERIFNLIGVDVKSWYRDMPRKLNYSLNYEMTEMKRRKLNQTINPFLKFSTCLGCSDRTDSGRKLCHKCLKDELATVLKLTTKLSGTQQEFDKLMTICRTCSSVAIDLKSPISNSIESAHQCTSDDCPIYYSRLKTGKKLNNMMMREAVLLQELNSSW